MRTDDLIARLAADGGAIRQPTARRLLGLGLAGGAVAAFVLTAAVLGLRRDFAVAAQDWQFWVKSAYPLALAVLAFPLVKRLSHPGVAAGRLAQEVLAPVVLLLLGALWLWLAAPADQRHHLLFGHSALVCPWLIVMVALPVFAGTLWALRQLAPTAPVAAGGAAGLLSGAAAAWIYAFHCNESSIVFVAVWYTAGIALSAGLGAIAGRWLLRW
jgi:hypothetical protein